MTRVCTICRHPDRDAIDAALIAGQPYRHIASQYGVGYKALERHKAHLSEHLLKARDNSEQLSASKLLQDLANLQAKALSLLDKAEKSKDIRGALGAIRECRGCIEAASRILEANELEKRIEALEQHLGGTRCQKFPAP